MNALLFVGVVVLVIVACFAVLMGFAVVCFAIDAFLDVARENVRARRR